ncbi:GDYXXLXY domain-containing protein [Candidatus Woesearchaeota archaeon]|nr:GDYXXLXY domain-containing protein [Candidatus Woesearchaeota archaeon]
MKELTRLMLALGILLGIAGVFILYLSWPLLTGTTVILKTQPVDPFDIFRGQYMTINYEISNVELPEEIKEGDNVYVLLKEGDDKIWHAERVSPNKPDNGVFIKGTARQSWRGLTVEYGIEQYFFERNAELPLRDLDVKAKIGSSGQARIVGLLQYGKPINITYRDVTLTS